MAVGCSTRKYAVFLTLILFCLFAGPGIKANAQNQDPFPWQTENSVKNALLQPDGTQVTCECAEVARIAARNNPAFFVIQDGCDTASRVVVLLRAPFTVRTGQSVTVDGHC